ncbi:hypothetical protein HQ524_02060 [Candidatus Uhrbacteria bacterium]|nr:hypothetical protein [Candidatus Uhrbacteria bacterium]
MIMHSRYIFPLLLLCAFSLSASTTASAAGWVEQEADSVTGIDIVMKNNQVGVALGGGVALYTTDGKQWRTSGSSMPMSSTSLAFAKSSSVVIATAYSGVVMRSADAGITWSQVATPTTELLYDISFGNDLVGWIVGTNGTILKTNDSGLTWTAQMTGGTDDYRGVSAIDEQTAVLAGENGLIYKTTDGGSNWFLLPINKTDLIMNIDFPSSTTGYISLYPSNAIFTTVDGGANWEKGANPGAFARDMDFFSNSVGSIATSTDVLETQDDSETWINKNLPPVSTLNGVTYGTGEDDLWTISQADGIWRYDAGSPSSPGNVASVHLADDVTPTWTWSASSDAETAVARYEVSLDGGSYIDIDLNLSYTAAALAEGEHALRVRAVDAAENVSASVSKSVTIDLSVPVIPDPDTSPPTIGTISPDNAVTGVAAAIMASVTDASPTTCTVSVDGGSYLTMAVVSGGVSRTYTFSQAAGRTIDIEIRCVDDAGNTSTRIETALIGDSPSVSSFMFGDLITMQCPGGESADHPCRAVYYYGSDGKRHPFPNARMFFTWYDDFDDVINVSPEALASVRLGSRVRYRPGVKAVKFQTLNTVYMVSRGGVLHAIANENVAYNLMGVNWNQQIDDIPDTFYSDYSYGSEINNASDYSISGAMAEAPTINHDFW